MTDLSDYFRSMISRYGDDARAAGWNSRESQERRFAIVAEQVKTADDVLDVGCGPAHLYDYLRERGWTGRYAGLDPLPEMIDLATSARRPARVGTLATARTDLGDRSLGAYDLVVSSGVVSMQLGGNEDRLAWLREHLRDATHLSRRAVVLNFLSARSNLYKSEDRWWPKPGEMVDEALAFAHRVTVRHDYYGEYDCSLVLHVDGDLGRR
jgi:SAM-dependent methyltransferase